MFISISRYFLLFMVYSFIGWCMETILISIQNKRFINRGFLIGPYCPIYGFGGLLITLVLGKYKYDALVLFVMILATCGILEYTTSWAMEVLFKARWWDYSKEKLNLNGRICLKNLVAFGLLGLLITYILNPIFMKWIDSLTTNTLKWTAIVVAILYIIDNTISFIVIYSFRKVTKNINNKTKEDNTEQITDMVKQLFSEKSFLHRRFINAYPNIESIKINVKQIQKTIKQNVNEAKNNISKKKFKLKKKGI